MGRLGTEHAAVAGPWAGETEQARIVVVLPNPLGHGKAQTPTAQKVKAGRRGAGATLVAPAGQISDRAFYLHHSSSSPPPPSPAPLVAAHKSKVGRSSSGDIGGTRLYPLGPPMPDQGPACQTSRNRTLA